MAKILAFARLKAVSGDIKTDAGFRPASVEIQKK
jgi:hypothetical protein